MEEIKLSGDILNEVAKTGNNYVLYLTLKDVIMPIFIIGIAWKFRDKIVEFFKNL
jgi:hypothetical protein